MKKSIRMVALFLVALFTVLFISGCSFGMQSDAPTMPKKTENQGGDVTKHPTEEVKKDKSQLNIYSYDGGYGSDWLYEVKKRFEEEFKDVSFEEGKTGVQIMITPNKSAITADSIKHDSYEIYFIEGCEDYHILRNKGCFEDLTSVVTSVSPYDNKTIESKLTDEQKAYWGVEESDEIHYYCLPHYEGYYGIIYNVDLFDNKGFYFADDKSEGDFILPGDFEARSAGPDGKKGTSDDGLPATYEEFFMLCDYIKEQSIVPLIWTGEVYSQYVTSLTNSLFADAEGKDQTMLNFTFDGLATDLGSIVGGEFVKDANPLTITGLNGYELARQEGKYQAIKFTETITKNKDYHNTEAFSQLSQLGAQERFLKASYGIGDGINDPCAMLIDGVWWENEAKSTFASMVNSFGNDASKNVRRFGFMYLPKANESKIGSKNVLCDVMNSKCFVKAGLNDDMKALALTFVQFVNSDESLREFTVSTGAPKAFKYELTDDDMAKLSPYAKSLLEYRKTADIIYPVSQNEIFVNNASKFDRINGLFGSKVGGKTLQTPVKGMRENNTVTTNDYFTGIYDLFREFTFWKEIK